MRLSKNWFSSVTVWFGIGILIICGYVLYKQPTIEAFTIFMAGIGVIYGRYTAKKTLK